MAPLARVALTAALCSLADGWTMLAGGGFGKPSTKQKKSRKPTLDKPRAPAVKKADKPKFEMKDLRGHATKKILDYVSVLFARHVAVIVRRAAASTSVLMRVRSLHIATLCRRISFREQQMRRHS